FEKLAVQVSHPAWMLERWANALGLDEASALALGNNQVPRAAFRINTLLATPETALAALHREGIKFGPSSLVAGAYIPAPGASLASTHAADRGWIYIQDEASQLVSLILEVESGQRVLDLCAAPGSKTSHIAALSRGESMIIACDLHIHRLATLASICKGLGA